MSGQEVEIPKHYQPQFTQIQEQLLQKQGSLLMDSVDIGDYKGESGEVVKQFGKTRARVGNEDRNGDTPIMSTPRDQRWVYPTNVDWGDLIEKADQLKQLIDPTSSLNIAANAAMGRAIDEDIILPAFFGDAKTGKNGSTTTAYPASANDIAITVGNGGSGNVGMNVEKLIDARRLARRFYWPIDREPMYCALTSLQESELLNATKFASRDFGEPVLDQGRLKSYMGFQFKVLEEFPWASNVRSLPVWMKGKMHLGRWRTLSTNIAPDPGKKFNTRVYMAQDYGATRTQENGVLRIKCVDTVGLPT